MDGPGQQDTLVTFLSDGAEFRGAVVRLARHYVVFEIYSPVVVLQKSEALGDFTIMADDKPVYAGRAVLQNLINTPAVCVCEAALEDGWLDVDFFGNREWSATLRQDFARFNESLRHYFKILPEFKVVVGDMQSALMELRRWMEQVELGIRSQPGGDRDGLERKIVEDLSGSLGPVIAELFERFNTVCAQVPEDSRGVHAHYAKRQLHPLVLCAPFMYRTFAKPLGFAGDYEMVAMMVRDPYEGGSVYAKVLNAFFLNTAPVVAHRNRIDYLIEILTRD